MSGASAVFCFDLDDTLVSESDYVESGLRAAGEVLDGSSPDGSAGEWLVALWRRERPRDAFQRLLRERALREDVWLPRLVAAYRGHTPALGLRGGVLEVLTELSGRGVKLALVTDGLVDVQRRKWASLRLPVVFDPVIFTDERGRDFWKPHPWAFERVMQAHPGATRFVYVADNPAKDFVAPNRLGWTSVMLRDAANVHRSDLVAPGGAPSIVVDSMSVLLELT